MRARLNSLEQLMPFATAGELLAESRKAVVTISPASPWVRAARAIEPPIRPKPISAMRLKGGSVLTCPP